jgi:hypothetical protein
MASNLGSNFYPKLIQMTSELGMNPEDLLATMVSESGIQSDAHNPGGASGLIQFIPESLKGVGYQGTPAEFRQTSGEEQLQYIKRYIQDKMKYNGGPFKSGAQYYVANFWPVALKLPGVQSQDPNTRIVEGNPEKDASGKYSKKYLDIGIKISASYESIAYKGNTLFDKGNKGYITYGDMEKQVEQNKRSATYQKAIVAMRDSTNYQPSNTTPVEPKAAPSMMANLEEMINEGLKMFNSVFAEETSLKRLYKKALPTHNILIQIDAPNYNSAIEFSRILTSALDEDLLSNSYPHTDGSRVEVECSIHGPEKECFEAVQQMSEAIAEAFKDATIKIGGLKVKATCIMNKKSSYQPISLRTATSNYRTFLLKFI